MSETSESFILEDGRRGERVVVENKTNGLESHKVIEVKVEEVRLRTHQRITEKMKSYMYERVTETIDQETGEVLETKVEDFDCMTGALKEEHLNGAHKLKFLSSEEELGLEEEEKGYDLKSLILIGIIVAQVTGLLYILLK